MDKRELPITNLTCPHCGIETKGRQWWNKDLGTGICPDCANILSQREGPAFMELSYGKKGYHYDITEQQGVETYHHEVKTVCESLYNKRGDQQTESYRILGELIGVNRNEPSKTL